MAITPGPDGALWFTQSDSIGRITTDGAMTTFAVPAAYIPEAINTGPDGALWFNAADVGAPSIVGGIGRITTTGVITIYIDPAIRHADAPATGPDGALWFGLDQDRTIVRLRADGLPDAPGPPTDLTAITTASTATITFDPPADTGHAPKLAYDVTCSAPADPTPHTASGTTSPLTITGLATATTYTCTATASNLSQPDYRSIPSSPTSFTTSSPATSAPPAEPVRASPSLTG